jgi:hypothetical protein
MMANNNFPVRLDFAKYAEVGAGEMGSDVNTKIGSGVLALKRTA